MAVDYQKLLNYPIPEVRQKYTRKDTMLYALGIGLGADPMDEQQLRYVYEDGLQVRWCSGIPASGGRSRIPAWTGCASSTASRA